MVHVAVAETNATVSSNRIGAAFSKMSELNRMPYCDRKRRVATGSSSLARNGPRSGRGNECDGVQQPDWSSILENERAEPYAVLRSEAPGRHRKFFASAKWST